MTITIMTVEACFTGGGSAEQAIVPRFDFLETDSQSFKLMRVQPQGDLTAAADTGVRSQDPLHLERMREAVRLARSQRADVFVTPEYSVPPALIDEIVRDRELQPPPHTLWCLCCEGMTWDEFHDHMNLWADYSHVGKGALEQVQENRFVGVLLYVFQSAAGDRCCIVPEFKLQPMREALAVCEQAGLSLGRRVVLFGEGRQNRLLSFICADAFHPDVRQLSFLFPGRDERNYIVLHPQLNGAPRHREIADLRQTMFRTECGQHTVYVTANWAAGTTIRVPQHGEEIRIAEPWSCVYRRYVHFGGESWMTRLREVRRENYRHGLGFAFEPDMQVKVWFAHKREHVQLLLLRKPFAGAAEIERPRGTVQALRSYVPTERRDGWVTSELPFEQSLPADLQNELDDDYQYPLRTEGEDRDRFFSYCLGQTDERPELTIAENELSYRVSCHVDDACESGRTRQARRIGSLIRCLRRMKQEQVPSQIGRLKGGHQFGTLPGTPVNLISKSEHARDAALVAYADHESDMKATAERLIGQLHYFMQDKVVVLAARDFSDDIVHYPVLNDNVTAPERRAQTTDYSQGGLTIEPSFD